MTTSPLGRRAGSALLTAVVVGGVVSLLFANPEPAELVTDPPPATVATRTAAPSTEPSAAPGSTTPATTAARRPPSTPTSTPTGPADPLAVAVAWYAKRHHLDRAKVTVLQADQLTANRVQVVLTFERANGRLASAIVTVIRSSTGSWTVRP